MASTWADAWSSEWTSSTRHTTGRSAAASHSKPSTASPTRNRSGALAHAHAERRRQRLMLWPWKHPEPAQHWPAQQMQPGERKLHFVLHAHHPGTPGNCRRRPLARYSSSADLPTPGSPWTTRARLSPARTSSTRRSSKSHSARRSTSGRLPQCEPRPTGMARDRRPGHPPPRRRHFGFGAGSSCTSMSNVRWEWVSSASRILCATQAAELSSWPLNLLIFFRENHSRYSAARYPAARYPAARYPAARCSQAPLKPSCVVTSDVASQQRHEYPRVR